MADGIHEISEDTILGGRIRLRQPCGGGRACIDTVLLAAAVPARAGERVIDAGCGTGAAALAVAARCAGAQVTGLERGSGLVHLACENAALNGLEDRVTAIEGDVGQPPVALGRGWFDHALANPPYYRADATVPPPSPEKARAFVGAATRLADWIGFCLDMLRERGSVTVIHRADRIDSLLAALHGRAGDIAVLPLWPRQGLPAKRVIVHARKGVKGASMLLPGLVLHDAAGRFTPEAEAILREGHPLDLSREAGCRLAKGDRQVT